MLLIPVIRPFLHSSLKLLVSCAETGWKFKKLVLGFPSVLQLFASQVWPLLVNSSTSLLLPPMPGKQAPIGFHSVAWCLKAHVFHRWTFFYECSH